MAIRGPQGGGVQLMSIMDLLDGREEEKKGMDLEGMMKLKALAEQYVGGLGGLGGAPAPRTPLPATARRQFIPDQTASILANLLSFD